MGHFADDQTNDEFMNASAEEWSKPSQPPEPPPPQPEPTDSWGSPIPDQGTTRNSSRWGSEPGQPSGPAPEGKKGGSNWWIILIVVLVVLCLCACLVLIGLPVLWLSLIPTDLLQF